MQARGLQVIAFAVLLCSLRCPIRRATRDRAHSWILLAGQSPVLAPRSRCPPHVTAVWASPPCCCAEGRVLSSRAARRGIVNASHRRCSYRSFI